MFPIKQLYEQYIYLYYMHYIIVATFFIIIVAYLKFNYIVILSHKIYNITHRYTTNPKDQIINNLWIGDHYSSLDDKFLIKNNIHLIINCTNNLKFTHLNIVKYRIPIDDNRSKHSDKVMIKYFNKYYHILDSYLNNNLGVLVHCHCGFQRSASLVCLYLMKKYNYSYHKAKNIIRSKRFLAMFPFVNFYKILTGK